MSELERTLRELGAAVELPPTPSLAPAVVARLPERRRPFRPLTLAFAAAALALAVAVAVPPARSALLRFLGLSGATIERVERSPVVDAVTQRPLGVRVSLDEARQRAGFRLRVPRADIATISFDGRYPGGAVTFAWRGRRLLLTEFLGGATPFIEKTAGPGTVIDSVSINARQAYWLSGDRHRVVFRDARGRIIESRGAGNVLLWEDDGVTLRLEGDVGREEALQIARSLR